MLCGYSLARYLVGPEVPVDDNGAELASIADRGAGPSFPPRYRGAFDRDFAVRHADAPGSTLSQPARDMLELRLGPQAASRLIDCVERMAAAAAGIRPDV
jgi:hypothetical protein